MKNRKHIALLLLLVSFHIFSQEKREKRIPDSKMKAYKIAYITEKLDLTEREAEKFWPVYYGHEKRITELRREESKNIRGLVDTRDRSINVDEISEANAKKLVATVAKIQGKIHAENKEFIRKLESIISYKKILKLKIAEREFKRKIFERIRKKRKRYKE